MSKHEGWQHRHVQALMSWERGDVGRLIRLCEREITTEASQSTKACRGAVSFDELAQIGREAVWKYHGNYDPKQGNPFQAFIRPHIRGGDEGHSARQV
jgi:DNA-directed RNA polymerase specialized sigma subunit